MTDDDHDPPVGEWEAELVANEFEIMKERFIALAEEMLASASCLPAVTLAYNSAFLSFTMAQLDDAAFLREADGAAKFIQRGARYRLQIRKEIADRKAGQSRPCETPWQDFENSKTPFGRA